MSNLKISSTLSLPQEAALWTFADLAIKGAGKTYVANILAEELIKIGVPIVAIDSMGIWWGLRVGVDGHKGLPVVVFGGKHKDLDIPTKIDKARPIIDEDRLKFMVKAILESRISAVVDTSDFSKGMRRRIVAIFASELYNLNQKYGARHVFLEEADEWIPQKLRGKDEWASACFGAIDDLIRKGGNYLLGCTLISQRSAVVSKDVLSQINCLIVLRILHELDKKAVKTWVDSMAQPNDKSIAKWYDSLRRLKNGEAWIWHPEEPEIFKRVQFRKRETLHATREYFQQAKWQQEDIKLIDVGEFISKFKNVFESKPKEQPKPKITVEPKNIEKAVPQIIVPQPRHIDPPQEKENTQAVQQSLPNIMIQKFKPNLNLPVEMLEQPTTPLGKVAVVLKNFDGRSDRWTMKSIKEDVRNHAWDDSGVEEAVDQMIRWEIIKKQSGYLKFYPERVQIAESNPLLEVR